MNENRWVGVPDTAEARAYSLELAGDDCPWQLLDAALDEIDRLRAKPKPERVIPGAVPVNIHIDTPERCRACGWPLR